MLSAGVALVSDHCGDARWAKSIQDARWAACLSFPAYKVECADRRVVAVNPAFTSQTCTGCGVLVQKGLSGRWRSCPDCGASPHRDHSAAKNSERAGQAQQGVSIGFFV
jgi:putative transposase